MPTSTGLPHEKATHRALRFQVGAAAQLCGPSAQQSVWHSTLDLTNARSGAAARLGTEGGVRSTVMASEREARISVRINSNRERKTALQTSVQHRKDATGQKRKREWMGVPPFRFSRTRKCWTWSRSPSRY